MSNFLCGLKARVCPGRRLIEACLVAVLLVVAAFPDVLFNGASLRLTDQITGAVTGGQFKSVYPIPNSERWWAGYHDNGGATYQSDPMIEFMAKTIKNAESPYWNPYSAAGALGPEALVDQKFSALTLTSALFGATSLSFNIAMIIAIYFGVFFIYRTMREIFGLSSLAATAAASYYLLNGYMTANMGSNVTQSYLYIPMCLFAALMLVERMTVVRWSMAVLAFAVFFSCTFMPTTITGFMAIGLIVIGCLWGHVKSGRYSVKQAGLALAVLATSLLAAILLLAPLYFPLLENIKSVGTLDDYAKRVFWPLHFPYALASFFSPTHFFESYNGMEAAATGWENIGSITGNTVFHSGVVALAFASCALSAQVKNLKWLVYVCAFSCAFTIVRLFDPVWVHWLFSYLPIVGNIGSQYWWPIIMLGMVVLVGVGVNNLQRRDFYALPYAVLMATLIFSLVYLYNVFGLHEPALEYKEDALYAIAALAALTGVVFACIKCGRKSEKFSRLLMPVLVLALFVELMGWGKINRYERSDIFHDMPAALQFVKDNVGNYRTLNFGQLGLDPEAGSAYRIQEISTVNQGSLPAYNDFFYSAINLAIDQRPGVNEIYAPRGSFPSLISVQDKPETNTIKWPLVSLMGVKYVLLPAAYTAYRENLQGLGFTVAFENPRTVVMENPNVLPRAFSVSAAQIVDKANAQLPANVQNVLVPASIDTYRNGEVVVSGEVTEESLVFLSDNWHANWSAQLNGQAVPLLKVDNTFRGVIVPPGHYILKMEYAPKTLRLALGSSAAIVLLLFLLGFCRTRVNDLVRRRMEAIR